MEIRTTGGKVVEAQYLRHLRTLTHGPGVDNTDVDLYRTTDGRLVVASSPANDGRAIPEVDPESSPTDYGIRD